MIERAELERALATVRDPELDEPITELGFVEGVDVDGAAVEVRLRLPTYFCAPNFAFLMAADARAAVERVAGVQRARIVLLDHFTAAQINAGVAGGLGFADAFPGEADGELAELRALFDRKAFLVRQERLCRVLMDDGWEVDALGELRLGELPEAPERERYLERRAGLGLDLGTGAPFLVRPNGDPVTPAGARQFLRFARTVRVSIEGNGELCRGLLATRYGVEQREVVTA
jgi:metal-sulfur cluster biosynthetic enzyme